MGDGMTMQQALSKRSNKLDAIQSLDTKYLKQKKEIERKDKDLRLQDKYKVCEVLPEDWALKTEIEIQMPLLKPIDDLNEILNYKDVARALNYYIYMEAQMPKFLQENQNAEYLRNEHTISWVKSFKDVYQKFITSYQHLQRTNPTLGENVDNSEIFDDLEMPCFYLRN